MTQPPPKALAVGPLSVFDPVCGLCRAPIPEYAWKATAGQLYGGVPSKGLDGPDYLLLRCGWCRGKTACVKGGCA